jgi:hypothetical protein
MGAVNLYREKMWVQKDLVTTLFNLLPLFAELGTMLLGRTMQTRWAHQKQSIRREGQPPTSDQ